MTRRKFLLRSACGFAIVALAASFAGHRLVLAAGLDEEQAELANALRNAKVSLQQGFMTSANGKASRFRENLRSKTANCSFPSIPQRKESFSRSSSIT